MALDPNPRAQTIDSDAAGRGRPAGRDEVRRAVIEAAVRLFAAHGPRAVSMRQVAAEADVNYGLIHRHFGSKEIVLDDAVEYGAQRLSTDLAAVTRADEAMDVLRSHGDYWRLLAFVCLEGGDTAGLERDFPAVAGLMGRLRALDPDSDDIGIRAAAGTALALGWVVFEPFLRGAAGLEQADDAGLVDGLAAALERAVGIGADTASSDRVDVARPAPD